MENETFVISENELEQHNTMRKLFLWFLCLLSIPILFIVQSVISMVIILLMRNSLFLFWVGIIFAFLLPIAFIVTLYGIYLIFTCKKPDLFDIIELENIEYVGFWLRVWAWIIDIVVSWFIIPIFFNLYFWLKDGQTIWYKIIWAKVYRENKWQLWKSRFIDLCLYPFLKMLNCITLFIWIFMIWWTEKKQWLHNKLWKTVVIKVQK